MTLRHKIVTAGLACALAGSLGFVALPTVAFADPADELAAAAAELESLGNELSSFQDQLAQQTQELENTDYAIAEKEAQIEQTRQELADKQAALGESMRGSYKSGTQTTLDFVLGSTSFEDLVNRIYYLDKFSEQKASAIEEVRTLESQLEQEVSELTAQQASQQQQVDDLQAQVSEYESRVAEATSYYNALDAEVQAQLAAEEAARNAAIAAAVQAAETSNAQTSASTGATGGSTSGGQTTTQTPSTPSADPTPSQPSTSTGGGTGGGTSNSGGSTSSGGNISSGPVGGGLSTAYAQLGKPYIYGATGPDAFDCSGLIYYCYGSARGRTTYDMITSLKSTGDWKTSMDELDVGDLVFPHSGHVGIYVGNGQYLHASSPGVGVVVSTLYSFIGGGSYY